MACVSVQVAASWRTKSRRDSNFGRSDGALFFCFQYLGARRRTDDAKAKRRRDAWSIPRHPKTCHDYIGPCLHRQTAKAPTGPWSAGGVPEDAPHPRSFHFLFASPPDSIRQSAIVEGENERSEPGVSSGGLYEPLVPHTTVVGPKAP